MGDKYIIELEDKPFHKENGDFLYRVKGFNSLVFDLTGISKLTPYIEPDMEQVRKEAYENGYENGFVAGHLKAEKSGQSFYEDGYKRGLADAWEAARKIANIPYGEEEKVFGSGGWTFIINHTASEAIEKIRAYEKEKEEQIQVGDEVVGTYTGEEETEPFVIIRKIPEINPTYYFGIYSKSGEFCQGGLKLKKTGRHFPEIAEVLQKMKES